MTTDDIIDVERGMMGASAIVGTTIPLSVGYAHALRLKGRARVLAPGCDVTLVGISYMAVEALRARALLADAGVEAEVIDPVSLSPLDTDAIVASASRTRRLSVVDNGWTTRGASAEIVARTLERLQGHQDITVQRLGFAPVPCPAARSLETLFYPDAPRIAAATHMLVRGTPGSWPSAPSASDVADFRGPF